MINSKIWSITIQFLLAKFTLTAMLELLTPVIFYFISDQFIQFERRCYARIDKVTLEGGDLKVNIFLVPDGKKVGLATIKTEIDKKGDIKKKDLADKVEDKKNKESKKEKEKKKKEAVQEQKPETAEEQKVESAQETKAEEPKTEQA